MRRFVVGVACAVILGVAGRAGAQTLQPDPSYRDPEPTAPLSRVIPVAIADGARLSDFRTREEFRTAFVVGTDLSPITSLLNLGIAQQLTTFPVATSWGGSLDASKDGYTTGPVSRSSFAERATTLGAGAVAFGFGQQSLHHEALDGLDIEDGGLKLFFQHNNCCSATGSPVAPGEVTDLTPEFERDLLEQTLAVDIDRNVFGFVLEYGLTDRVDVGVTIPIVKVDIRTRVHSRILRTATEGDPSIHKFDPLELATRTTYASGHARGLGDIVLRGKVGLVKTETGGIAAGVNVSLPTGDEVDLLGSGATRVEGKLIWSGQFGRVGAHLNAGYTYSDGGLAGELVAPGDPNAAAASRPEFDLGLPDEIGVVGGVEVALARRVGISGDIIARQLRDVWRFEAGTTNFPGRGPGPTGAPFAAVGDLQSLGKGNITQLLTAIGMRVHLGGPLLLSGDVILPITDDGLTPKAGAVVGFSVAF